MSHAAGADALILQGVEAGGHVRGQAPGLELLDQVRSALPPGYPLLLAGGIADREDVERVSSREPLRPWPAPASYSPRRAGLTRSTSTASSREIARSLPSCSGSAGPRPHRVVPNAATDRWLAGDEKVPAPNRALNGLSAFGARYAPPAVLGRVARRQRAGSRLLTPTPATDDGPANLVDAGPLYAGETVARIGDIRPAGELVRSLSP